MVQKFLLIILSISALAMSVFAAGKNGKDTVPSWLDTIAPVVKADPSKRLHSSMFYIKLTSNERAQIWYSLNTPDSMKLFNSPVYISKDGDYKLYYYAEDDFA